MRKILSFLKTKHIKFPKNFETRAICLFISFITLVIGLIPYLFIRTSHTYISIFLDFFFNFKTIALDEESLFYALTTSYFSDFCWAFAMPFLLFAVTNGKFSKCFYILGTPIIGSILEFFQLFDILDGVGDIIDAIIYFLASFLGYMFIKGGVLKWQTNRRKNTKRQKINQRNYTGNCSFDCCSCHFLCYLRWLRIK